MRIHAQPPRVRASVKGLALGRGPAGRVLRLVLLVVLAVAAGAWLRGQWFFGRMLDQMRTWPALVQRRVDGMLANVERITLDIHHPEWQVLVGQRERALARQLFQAGEAEMVPARLHFQGRRHDVKLRLKGDLVDQFVGDKWSFRVRVEGEDSLSGMKQFSLHDPAARNGLTEWLWHQTLRREDVLALRYWFVALTVNGKDLGVYAVEEHFEKRLLEHQRRREGPILRFDETAFWVEHVQQMWPHPDAQTSGAGSLPAAAIDTFQPKRTLAEGKQREEFETALALLERMRRGELPTSAVLDVERMARYWALADLFGAEHGARWHNVRFYWNPVTARLEPIGFDGNAGQLTRSLTGTSEGAWAGAEEPPPADSWYARVAADPVFFTAYIRTLARVAEPDYLERLLNDLGSELHNQLRILRSERPSSEPPDTVLRRNQAYIRSMLSPPQLLHAYRLPAGPGGPGLEVAAVQALPVEVLGIESGNTVLGTLSPTVWLPGFGPGRPPRFRSLPVALPPAPAAGTTAPGSEVVVRCRVPGTMAERRVPVFAWPRLQESQPLAAWRQLTGNVERFPFLVPEPAAQRIHVRPGSWRIDQDLVIPAGMTLSCREGTSLDLVRSALILCRGPLDLAGTREHPIRIHSTDGTGQGLVLLDAGARSTCAWVEWIGLTLPSRTGLGMTGSVTAYASPLTLTSCTFADNHAEDALNTIRTDLVIEDCTFKNTSGDALDCDFCTVKVRGTTFDHPTNDAIDVSGSALEVEDVVIVGAGDKGISVGENSQGVVRSVNIRNSQIAVASKDLSELLVMRYDIRDGSVGFTAYQKKPEFGPARIQIHENGVLQVERGYLIEVGSQVLRGSNELPATLTDVDSLLYGAVYGRASR